MPKKYRERLTRSRQIELHYKILHSGPMARKLVVRYYIVMGALQTYGILGIATAVCVKWKIHVLGEVGEIGNGIFQSQVLQILSCQVSVRR